MKYLPLFLVLWTLPALATNPITFMVHDSSFATGRTADSMQYSPETNSCQLEHFRRGRFGSGISSTTYEAQPIESCAALIKSYKLKLAAVSCTYAMIEDSHPFPEGHSLVIDQDCICSRHDGWGLSGGGASDEKLLPLSSCAAGFSEDQMDYIEMVLQEPVFERSLPHKVLEKVRRWF